jgi:hypothetical protein
LDCGEESLLSISFAGRAELRAQTVTPKKMESGDSSPQSK